MGMKKYFILFILSLFIIVSVFSFGNLVVKAATPAGNSSLSQLVELLINIGVIPMDKVPAARALVIKLNQPTVATSSLPYIQVLMPNGGESWRIDLDVPYTVTWGISGQFPVMVSLISNNAKVPICNLKTVPVISHNGNNTLNVLLKTAQCYNPVTGTSTPLAAGSYKFRVSYVDPSGATVKDESNANFTITPVPVPSLKVTYPNGAEKLISNNYYDIKYILTNTTERGLKISLLDHQGDSAYSTSVFGSKGTYHFKIPSSVNAGAYKLKVEMIASDSKRTKVEDTSDNFFWISDAP